MLNIYKNNAYEKNITIHCCNTDVSVSIRTDKSNLHQRAF